MDSNVDQDPLAAKRKASLGDPYRRNRPTEEKEVGKKEEGNVSRSLKRRLKVVEEELEDSKNEIKQLKLKLDTSERERKEILSTVSSMYVQIQYWNSWLGKFSSQMKDKCEFDIRRPVEDSELDVDKEKKDCDDSINIHKDAYDNGINEEDAEPKVEETARSDEGKDEEGVMDQGSVANMLKETAENAFASTGMSYDANSGLYYDWNTHMYYDPATHLFYDNDNGIYYYYDNTKGSYVFYSQVGIKSPNAANESPSSNQDKSEGEISSTESESEVEYVPGVRAIVTQSEELKPGTLHLVTCSGANLGRDKQHVFCIPDSDVSKTHAEIKYDEKEGVYCIKDKGSINGTFLNDKRLSDMKKESKWVQIKHKDFLKVGSTVFTLHLHQKNETCDGCEPGQVQALLEESKIAEYENIGITKEQARKKQLKGLKQKYLITGDGLKQALKPIESGKYTDRASHRRKKVGSEPINNHRPVAETKASVTKKITRENKGHQMMEKMGWTVGEGLGKRSNGITEPINAIIREKNTGLGSGVTKSIDDANGKSVKFKWKKAKQRYDDIIQGEMNGKKEPRVMEEFDF